MRWTNARLRSSAEVVHLAIWCLSLFIVAPIAVGQPPEQATEFTAEQIEFFEREVRPLLVSNCFECHSAQSKKLQGGLRVDGRDFLLTGGDTGPAAVPGSAQESLLIDAVNYGDLYQMPPKSKLSDQEIQVLSKWVDMGLPWPADDKAAAAKTSDFDLEERKASHWAWQPVHVQSLPEVTRSNWSRDPLDRFILAKLELHDPPLEPALEADRRTWIRRVYFDLTGLPPPPEKVQQFLDDSSDDAFENVVDQLLRAPQFGERWARHWLDLVRYAESRGHEFDYTVPNAWQYRDYVIRALNEDLPYDQFVLEHIAGDLLEHPRRHPTQGFNESVLATGFWFMGEWVHSPVDIRKDECDRFDNMIDVFSKTFLGLTVACARCHEHKFDAISQKDYYALAGFLQSTAYRQVSLDPNDHNRKIAEQIQALRAHYQPLILKASMDARRDTLSRIDEVLLASTEALQTCLKNVSAEDVAAARNSGSLPSGLSAQAQAAANRFALPGNLVEAWTVHLLQVQDNPRDPFWLWAQIANRATGQHDVGAMINEWNSKSAAEAAQQTESWRGVTTVIDYSGSTQAEWMSDGYAFGLGPVRTGQWTSESGVLEMSTYGSARRDPLWTGLQLAEGVDGEVAKLGSWNRAGQVIRTPTFEIDQRPLHYLVRGSGVAYAVVDSHAMINGPLHGSLIHEFKSPQSSEPRWVTHDLGRYEGHDAHVEFSPVADEPLEILMVVQADNAPVMPRGNAAAIVLENLSATRPANTVDLAAAYRELLIAQLDAADDAAPGCSADRAAFIDWIFAANQSRLTIAASDMDQSSSLQAELGRKELELASQIDKSIRAAPAMWEGSGRDERLLIRGNSKTPGDAVPRRFLQAIAGDDQTGIEAGSGRLELARRLLSPDNPFVSRVYVNRIWHHLMGRGIVASTDNFGLLGEPPTHPELLDYLAAEFTRDGWSTKRLIRRIVLSSTYRMSSSSADPAIEQLDPQNRLWHRMPIRRLEGEVIRDSLLAIAGRLDDTMYGRSVPVHLTPFMQGRGRPEVSGAIDGGGRRSIYIAVRRNFLSPMMLAFDTPQPFSTVGRRSVSNVPAQALILMNDPFVLQQCELWAARLIAKQHRDEDVAITELYQTAFSRGPTSEELAVARKFIDSQCAELQVPADQKMQHRQVWTDLCHVIVNLKEFIFIR